MPPLARFIAMVPGGETGESGFPQFPHPAPTLAFAVVIARSADGVVLVFNRYRKLWELPGGLIDAGETPREAAQRELLEEAECHARDVAWLGVVEVHDGATHFGAVFRCEVDDVPVKVQTEEIGGIAFWQRGICPQPLGETDAALLTRFG